jgi:trk system potassium uptake protein
VSASERGRAKRRAPLLAVDVVGALHVVATLLAYLSLAVLLPTAFAIGYGEQVWPFLAAGAITGAIALAVAYTTRGDHRLGIREGFLVVALTWLAAAAFGALPYVLSGDPQLDRPIDAFFEGMSGFSTTGGSVVTHVEELPRSLAIWRQFTQWLGGIGIIVLALAVLPRLRVGGRQLLEHEMPGPEIETLSTRIRDTARRVWVLYIALTAALFGILLALWVTGVDERMSPYQSFAHALTTIPTAGFSTRADSIESFAAATQWVIVLFMILGGFNFALMYRTLVRRQPRALVRDGEARLYVALLVLGSVIVVAEIWTENVFGGADAFRAGVFTAVSTMTTTGFSVADYNTWPALAMMTIVGLMFVGGSAGSTTGSVKVVRHLLLGKILRREIDQTLHPEIVLPVRLNRRVVDERTLRAVSSFILLYIGIFILGAAALAIDAARTGLELSPFDAVSVSASMLSNVGPAFGVGGPLGSFEPFSDFSTLLMTGLMWMGRLEIVPIVVLVSRHYWRNA